MFRAIIFTCLLAAVSAYWIPQGRIVGGNEITIDQRPFQVSLNLRKSHYCGGSIIDQYTILTAAHCSLNSPNDYEIRAGSTQKNSGGQLIKVASIKVHPRYSSSSFDYDVAIMKLSEPLRFDKDVQAIEMAPKGHIVPDGDDLVVSGWGTLSSGGSSPINLNEVKVPTVNQDVCIKAYPGSITDRMICAGVTGRDSCQGDSGGPLTQGRYHVGIVSWGAGCASAGYPGVYARTSELREFIDENM